MLEILKVLFCLFALCITSGFFLGFLPGFISRKPGSGGGLAGSIIGLCLLMYIFFNNHSVDLVISLIIITFLLGLFLIGPAEAIFYLVFGERKRHTGKQIIRNDYNHTIIDEVHGQLIAGLPVFFMTADHWWEYTLAFISSCIWFRIFDVTKPWFIKNIENKYKGVGGVKESFSIMTDDSTAGVLAAIITWLLIILINGI